jgi:DNA-binding Lrp family transcriptional regulator
MKVVRTAEPSGYERIRRFLLTWIVKSGGEPMRLASAREIAAEFGVTHTTVVRVIKDLEREGYINIKKGVGVFTNPRFAACKKGAKTIAILFGDGRTTFLPECSAALLEFRRRSSTRSPRFQAQNCFLSSKNADAAEEIANLGYDGVMWFNPVKERIPSVKRLKNEFGMAVLTAPCEIKGVSSVALELQGNFTSMKLLIGMGRKRLLWIVPEDEVSTNTGAVFQGAPLRRLETSGPMFLKDSESVRNSFAEISRSLNPDAIIFSVSIIDYWEAIKSNPGTFQKTLFSSGEWTVFKDMEGYRGILAKPKIREAAEKGVDDFIDQLEGRACEPLTQELEVEYEFIGMERPS